MIAAAASKPTRDPRLLRQQPEKTSNGTATTTTNSTSSLGSKPTIVDSNNKIVTNTKSIRDSRVETRLVNKEIPPSSQKPDKSKIFPKSRQSELKSSRLKNTDTESKTFSTKSDSKSPTKSPSKHKKKDHVSTTDKKSFKDSKRDGKNHSKSESVSTTFKGMKGSKNRNFRRNRSPSFSPELNQDTDLRISGPPEKQARLQDPEDKSKCNFKKLCF